MVFKGRPHWDAVRFVTTLNYFGEIPFLGSFRWIQALFGKTCINPGADLSKRTRKVILFGCRSLQQDHELQVQLESRLLAVEPPIELSSVFLEANISEANISEANISEANIKRAEHGADIVPAKLERLVCSADTAILLNSLAPSTLAASLVDYLGKNSDTVWRSVFDFGSPNCDLSAWGALDDVVMGGVSQGSFFLRSTTDHQPMEPQQHQQAVFAGNVSTSNSGGFSSVRTQNFDPPFDFSGWDSVVLRVKGDGQRYKFIARNSAGWDSPAYIYSFDTVAGAWIDVKIPFAAMVPTFRARSLPDAPAFDPARVFSFQLMLSKFEYDRKLNPRFSAGTFELAVSYISVQRPRQGIPLIVVGGPDAVSQEQHQAILNESQVNYRLIERLVEPEVADVVGAIAEALC
ncbi:MAG: CIA30 family protein [Phormidesmis sp. RL_2_1]|nr:CIA30 family protein [Phormidesmis sp. RL_2_1]